VLAALLGIVTPFCSCSAVPLFIGFVTAGVPLGVTFSLLISAPMVNEVAVVLLFGLFGWKVAGHYTATGVPIAIISGWTIGRLRLERHVEAWVYKTRSGAGGLAEERLAWADRLEAGWQAMKQIAGKVWPAARHRGGSRHPRLRSRELHGLDHGQKRCGAFPSPCSSASPCIRTRPESDADRGVHWGRRHGHPPGGSTASRSSSLVQRRARSRPRR